MTSVEPTYWGVGSNVFALLGTFHQHGEQKHPAAEWLKELVEHPTQALGINDPRYWPERSFAALCMQTSDTSIELYWRDGLLRSRQDPGTPPSVHIPIVEEFVDRWARKLDGGEGALLSEVINRNAPATSPVASLSPTPATWVPSIHISALSGIRTTGAVINGPATAAVKA